MTERRTRSAKQRGQAMVEFTVVLPLLLILVLAVSEFGMMLNHHLTLEYATREGARIAAALVNGGGPMGCGAGQSPDAADVDPRIIAAVQRVLDAPGSNVDVAKVTRIRIYDATSGVGSANEWSYARGGGPVVDGVPLDFVESSNTWPACSRSNEIVNHSAPGSIGVDLEYTYTLETPIGSVMRLLAGSMAGTVTMSDKTVMQLEPTS